MKILVITQKVDKDDSVLGFFHGWIEHLAENAEEVKVIALAKGRVEMPKNVEVTSLGKEHGASKILQALRFYMNALRFLPQVDGVFVHMAPEYVRALYPLNIFFRKPLIMWYAHIKVSPVAKWALGKADRILTPSRESFSVYSEKVVSTGHGIDTDLFKPLGKMHTGAPIILTMSRIAPVKRLNVFVEALRKLKNDHPGTPFRAVIAGKTIYPEDEKYKAVLEKEIDAAGLKGAVSWMPEITQGDMPEVYNQADLYVRTQGGGGFGKAELAALACGIPTVLSTPVYNSYLPEFAEDMYFDEDDALKCAENMARVLKWSLERKEKYSAEARRVILEHHNLDTLAKRIVSEFQKLLISRK